MSPPTTLTKVYNALVRHLPGFFLGKLLLEAMSHAVALARANDTVESMLDELFGDTASLSIDRWERVHRVPSRPTDDLQARRDRVLTVLQRTNGPQPERLQAMLANVLDCSEDELALIEQTRANIEAGLTLYTGTLLANLPVSLSIGAPFPGLIDDMGVRLYIDISSIGSSPAVTLKHADGTSWTFAPTALTGWYENRTAFIGKSPAGMWHLDVSDAAGGAHVLTEARLLVSNDEDSAQIYQYYAVRDAGLGGAPDLAEAQRQFTRHALGHMAPIVAEHSAAICDEAHSLCDREPVGA